MKLLTIDPSTGTVESTTPVTGLDDNPTGGAVRQFLFDGKRGQFYSLDANFTVDGGVRPESGRPMYLYSVDARTGVGSKRTVGGATDYPVGYAMDPSTGTILINTVSPGGEAFLTYSLDPETADAIALGAITKGKDERSESFYAGYHRAVSPDGKQLFRYGYQYVSSQQKSGVSVTATHTGNSTWYNEQVARHDFYMSLDVYANESGTSTFVSLAPNTADGDALDVVQWDPVQGYLRTVATLGNAHPPHVPFLGDLGFMAASVRGSQFVGFVSYTSDIDPNYDGWALAAVDLATGETTTSDLSPTHYIYQNSVAGIGLLSA
jgi:hypothetical protein